MMPTEDASCYNKSKESIMAKYYVVGLTSRDVVSGIGVKLHSCSSDMFSDVFKKNKGAVMIYSKEPGGKYHSIEYIHESLYGPVSNFCAVKAIEVIEEEEIPQDAAIVLRSE
jgi:hypothetical protein